MNGEREDWVKRREPFRFMLYLGIGGSSLLFLAIFMVYARGLAAGQQAKLIMPNSVYHSTILIGLSSLSLFLAGKYFKVSDLKKLRIALLITLGLGFGFMLSQFQVWKALFFPSSGSDAVSIRNTAGLVYVLTGLHLIHILGGLVALFVTTARIFRKGTYVDTFIYTINPPNQLNIKLLSVFWHFLGVLWLIIFLVLVYMAK